MTDHKEIPCQIRNEKPPYAYCYDDKGKRSKTQVLGHTYPGGKRVTHIQCLTNPKEHRFKIDREGNVVNE